MWGRYLSAGWQRASAKDLDDIYENELEAAELKRVAKLELFDEFEEWHMISQHYTCVHAASGLCSAVVLMFFGRIVVACSHSFSALAWKDKVSGSTQ